MFNDWINKALDEKSDSILLEPFAGSNSIIKLIRDAYPELNNQWHCFDIDPESNEKNLTDIPITIQDVLSDFPKSYHIAITNPPYLAKTLLQGVVYHFLMINMMIYTNTLCM